MASTNRVEAVVRAAWDRRLRVLAVERGAIAAAVLLGGFVLLLLLGTQILSPYWLALLTIFGLGVAIFQIRRRILAHYRVAQLLDRRLSLADSLSSAWYLLSQPGKQDSFVAQFLLRNAETKAQSVNVAEAFPYTGKRPWSVAGGLAALALVLFSVRYLTTDSLNLHKPLIHLPTSDVTERTDPKTAGEKRGRTDKPGADQKGNIKGQTTGNKDMKQADLPQPPPGQPNDQGLGQNRDQQAELRESQDASKSPLDQHDGKTDGAQKAGEEAGDKQNEESQASKDALNAPKTSNGIVDRVKDALSSLAAKMKPNSQSSQQSDQRNGEDRKSDAQSSPAKEQNASRPDSAGQTSEQQQSSQAQAQGQSQEKARAGQGKSADPFGDKNKPDSRSGVGSQDGDKALKDAEQLKAMGKLAEILGKRAANASGDMTIEKSTTGQQLKTQYSQRVGQHQNLGGEINRDEIPLVYRQYVREYMSQIRRASAHKSKAR